MDEAAQNYHCTSRLNNVNSSPFSRRKAIRRNALVWSGVGAVATLLATVGLLLSGASSSESLRPLPAGQFQADARTFVAALSYLLETDTDVGWSPAPPTTSELCGSSSPIQLMPLGSFCCVSNQSDLFSDPLTNGPARS